MPQSHVRREAMEISGKALVRRWGGRAVGLAVTGIGLYVVAPSLLTMFGAWPRLADVEVRWFAVLAALETCSFAALWWLARIALTPVSPLRPQPLRFPGPAPHSPQAFALSQSGMVSRSSIS